jgi:septum formation protein
VVPDVDELGDGDPVDVARENARRKAEAADVTPSGQAGETPVVIGVDTIVVLDGRIFGKPRDEDHARDMLTTLSGHTHEVVSGLAVTRSEGTEVVHATTRVTFRNVAPLLDWYLETGEWRERAGGYAIQGRGAAFVRWIDGDYLNVVGLPVAALLDLWPGVLDPAR